MAAPFKPNTQHHYRAVADVDWHSTADATGHVSTEKIQMAVLLEIRDELRRLNALLHCSNFVGIPHALTAIRKNTTKRKRKPSKGTQTP